jgi:hypothetical protein
MKLDMRSRTSALKSRLRLLRSTRRGSRVWRCVVCAAYLALSLQLQACRGKSSDYEELCRIYNEYSKPDLPRDVAAVKITERVEHKLPGLYERYVVIAMNPVEGRYQAFKDLAASENVANWSCDAIRTFYEVPRPPR